VVDGMTTYKPFTATKSSPSLWPVLFDNSPINLIDAVMMKEHAHPLTNRDKPSTALP